MSTIRVLLADDEPNILQSLGALVADDPALELVGSARDADQAIELALRTLPDVAIVDVRMPFGGGPRATREIKAVSPSTRVIAHSAYPDRSLVVEMLEAGAIGYLVKGRVGNELLDSIHKCAAGQSALTGEVAAEVIEELVGQLHRQEPSLEKRRESMAGMRAALAGEGLTMVFQPIFQLQRREIAGVEALARFSLEPVRPPDAWFREAKELGVATQLEMTAARAALVGFRRLGEPGFLCLNLSAQTATSPQFKELVSEIEVESIVIEVTEHEPIEDYEALTSSLKVARERGLRIAVDDAGAGFASLRHIVRLRPDFTKLDVTLIRDIDKDEVRRAAAAGIVSLANEIGSSVVAEGIETETELETVKALGVRFGQGFHLARPAPPELLNLQRTGSSSGS